MSLQSTSLAFIGPGYSAMAETHPDGAIELRYVRNQDAHPLKTEAFAEWLRQQSFSLEEKGWRCKAAGIAVTLIDDHDLVAGVAALFDYTKSGRLSGWLAFCESIIGEFGFRVTSSETAGIDEVRKMIESSVAWQVNEQARPPA